MSIPEAVRRRRADAARADPTAQALDELVQAGIPRESLGVLYGERGAAAIAGRQRRWLEELLSDEPTYVDRYGPRHHSSLQPGSPGR